MFKYMWKTIFGKSKIDVLFEQVMEYTEAVQNEFNDDLDNIEEEIKFLGNGTNEVLMALAMLMKIKPKKLAETIAYKDLGEYRDEVTAELLDTLARESKDELE